MASCQKARRQKESDFERIRPYKMTLSNSCRTMCPIRSQKQDRKSRIKKKSSSKNLFEEKKEKRVKKHNKKMEDS
jgi:hypothetical protein